jgi:hypothetical protein
MSAIKYKDPSTNLWEEVGEIIRGKDAAYVGSSAPTDPQYTIWVDTSETGEGLVTSVNGQVGAVTVTIPTKVSDLQNDSAFVNAAGAAAAAPVQSVNGKTGAVDITFENVTVSNQAVYHCSGTINGFPAFKVSSDNKFLWISGRPYISSYSRSGANPGISFQTNLTPSSTVSRVVGIRGEGTESVYPEIVTLSIDTTGAATLTTSETFSNASHGNRLIFIIPSCIIPI